MSRGLVDSFISQGSRSGDDSDLALAVNVSWHNSDLALTWFNDSWAVWSNQSGLVLRSHDGLNLDHVEGWDSFGDANDEVDFGFDGLEDGIGGKGRWHVDNGSLSLGCLLCFGNVAEDWKSEMF